MNNWKDIVAVMQAAWDARTARTLGWLADRYGPEGARICGVGHGILPKKPRKLGWAGRWQPAEAGDPGARPLLLLGVGLADVVAWEAARPGRWFLLTGAGDWLGATDLRELDDSPGRFEARLCATPDSWLATRAPVFKPGKRGPAIPLGERTATLCRLTPVAGTVADNWPALLSGASKVICDDFNHARALHTAMAQPIKPPSAVMLGYESAEPARASVALADNDGFRLGPTAPVGAEASL